MTLAMPSHFAGLPWSQLYPLQQPRLLAEFGSLYEQPLQSGAMY